MDSKTIHAMNRFGLGVSEAEAKSVSQDPQGWVVGQIGAHAIPSGLRGFKSTDEIVSEIYKAARSGSDALNKARQNARRTHFQTEVAARTHVMISSQTPFAERMVKFWSNHFTVSSTKSTIAPILPAYEREAIRPHIFGNFGDMLRAVVQHPAMLSYLDNHASIGENSPAGKRLRKRNGSEKTLNENLAREILELHTLGVDGGYSQSDVIEFAKAISGWSHGAVRQGRNNEAPSGKFEFRAIFHEPGAKRILGKNYREEGVEEGLQILGDLAQHPATATFIATKLVRHFVSDTPPKNAVERIAKVFRDSDGDLAVVSRAMAELDEAWNSPLSKVKTHFEYLISVHRATGNRNAKTRDIGQPLREMGQLPFAAVSPAGWGDEARHWTAPQSLLRRIEWVRRYAATLPANLVPAEELEHMLGPFASNDLRKEVRRAPSGRDAMTLILASPEFQRR